MEPYILITFPWGFQRVEGSRKKDGSNVKTGYWSHFICFSYIFKYRATRPLTFFIWYYYLNWLCAIFTIHFEQFLNKYRNDFSDSNWHRITRIWNLKKDINDGWFVKHPVWFWLPSSLKKCKIVIGSNYKKNNYLLMFIANYL